jgi:hypothetical protein
MRHERHVVIRWCPSSSSKPEAPHCDEWFHGCGKNKIELISHLRSFMGHCFSVLPEGFIVHDPHPELQVKETWKDWEGSDLHATMDKLCPKFLKELDSKHKQLSDSIVKPCKKRQHKSTPQFRTSFDWLEINFTASTLLLPQSDLWAWLFLDTSSQMHPLAAQRFAAVLCLVHSRSLDLMQSSPPQS